MAQARRPPSPLLDFRSWIVWEDEGLIAVDKPAGVLSQGGEGGHGINLVDLAREYTGKERVGVLHRLDRNVSGVVLLAKLPHVASLMTKLIAKAGMARFYRAVVRGEPREKSYVFDAWLAKDERTNEVRACAEGDLLRLREQERALFRPARTEATVEELFRAPVGPCAQLEVRPITGRSHQIRVHLAFGGFPIVGDPKYGTPASVNRPLLHAFAVVFRHPLTRKEVRIEAKVPWSIESLQKLRGAPASGR